MAQDQITQTWGCNEGPRGITTADLATLTKIGEKHSDSSAIRDCVTFRLLIRQPLLRLRGIATVDGDLGSDLAKDDGAR